MEENWRGGSVLEQQKHMLETGYRSDCSFIVGHEPDTKEFRVHKTIMSRSSEVFDAMFYGARNETDVVRVTDVTPETFQVLLYHVYCDTLEISDVEMSLSVCSAAHKYNLQPLINKCADYITEHMTPVNVCQVLEFSNLTDNTQLKQHCINMLQSRTEEVLSADSWCDVQVSSIVTLLQQDTLNVQSELSLLSACQRWAQHQLDVNNQQNDNQVDINNPESQVKLREIIAPLLPHIRILSLTPQQFLQSTEGNPVFSEQEQFQILKCLTEPQKYKMPEGMCEISTAREIMYASFGPANILDEITEHLEAKQLVKAEFDFLNWGFIPSITIPMNIKKHIVVYGFTYQTLQFSQQDRLTQARLSKNKMYDENCTVQFMNEADKCVVAEYKFEGTLKYDAGIKVDLSQPFLAQRSIPYSFKVEFHHQYTDRKYPLFYKPSNSRETYSDINFSVPSIISFPCINKLLYKLV